MPDRKIDHTFHVDYGCLPILVALWLLCDGHPWWALLIFWIF
jgi:hypothetical protein